jgi:hypothetical protein
MALILAHPTLNNTRNLKNQTPVAKPTVQAKLPDTPPVVQTAVAVQAPTPPVAPTPPAPTVDLSDHDALMARAGISQTDWPAVDYIVSHESSWNPDATEPTTGAHGLVQALPYSKTGCGWDDAVCQLAWGQSYAAARYGGWWAAMNYWEVHRNW